MKKRLTARVLCLVVAASLLAGALTVAAIHGSPYEVLKNAAFGAAVHENATIDIEISFYLNGELDISTQSHLAFSSEASLSTYHFYNPGQVRAAEVYGITPETYSSTNTSFRSRELMLNIRNSVHGMETRNWNNAHIPARHDLARFERYGFSPLGFTADQLTSNYFRLAELALDFFVGDLRNNMYMTSLGDGVRRISGTITENQVPELVRILIDIFLDAEYQRTHRFVVQDPQIFGSVPFRSIVINRASGHADVDSAGNLLYLNAAVIATVVDVLGTETIIENVVVVRVSNIGTTVPQVPVPGAAELFTRDFFIEHFDNAYVAAGFVLDEDGNIDHESISRSDHLHVRW